MDPLLNLEMNEARRHELERVATRRRRRDWPDDGLPPRTDGGNDGSLHPAAVLARVLSWR